MKPGPKKMPRGLAAIRGKHVPPGLEPPVAASPPPKWLSQAAKAEWRRLQPELTRLGLLTVLDVAMFSAYCQAYARWRRHEEQLAKVKNELVKAKRSDYVQAHPLVSMVKSALESMTRLAACFGLTPADRASLAMPLDPMAPDFKDPQPGKPAAPKASEFDKFLRRKSKKGPLIVKPEKGTPDGGA